MHLLLFLLVAPFAIAAQSSSLYTLIDAAPDSNAQAFYEICAPQTSEGHLNIDYPCNIAIALEIACAQGDASEVFSALLGETKTNPDTVPSPLPIPLQRRCACESEFFDQMRACQSCLAAHGGDFMQIVQMGAKGIVNVTKNYCRSSTEPTDGLWDTWKYAVRNVTASHTGIGTTTFIDPLGSTATDVSLYYQPSVTGSAALKVPAFASSRGAAMLSAPTTSTDDIPVATSLSVYGGGTRTLPTTSPTGGNHTQTTPTRGNHTQIGPTAHASAGGVAHSTGDVTIVGLLGAAAVMLVM